MINTYGLLKRIFRLQNKDMTTLQDKIKAVYKEGLANHWNYPQLFKGLKEAGVTSYSVDVIRYRITYFSEGRTFVENGPKDWKVEIGSFKEEEVVKAIRRAQRRETNYQTFLKEIAAAGIPKYYVSMSECAVNYLGVDIQNKYVEKIPVV